MLSWAFYGSHCAPRRSPDLRFFFSGLTATRSASPEVLVTYLPVSPVPTLESLSFLLFPFSFSFSRALRAEAPLLSFLLGADFASTVEEVTGLTAASASL